MAGQNQYKATYKGLKNNFSGGEIAPEMKNRIDMERYSTFLEYCENFILQLTGSAKFRPGLEFILDITPSEGPVCLVPFSFNTDPEDNYTLVFTDEECKAIDYTGAVDATLTTPYTTEDLEEIWVGYDQSGDVVYLAHPNQPLAKISRSGVSSWTYEEVELIPSILEPNDVVLGGTSGSYELFYAVTAVDPDTGEESLAAKGSDIGLQLPSLLTSGQAITIEWDRPHKVCKDVKSVIFDFADNWSAVNYLGVTSIEFEDENGVVIPLVGTDFTAYATTEISTDYLAEFAFDTSLSKTGTYILNSWRASSPITQRLIIVFNNAQSFRRIIINNIHNSGSNTDIGVKNTKIYTSINDETPSGSPVYGEEISNSELIFDGQIAQHVASDVIDDQEFYPVCFTYSYRVYRGEAGTYGLIGLTDVDDTDFSDVNYTADLTTTIPVYYNPFEDGNYPSTIGIHQQRLFAGGSKDYPQTIYGSKSGSLENFNKSVPTQDDDSLEYVLSSGSIDQIVWIASFSDLMIGTSGSEHQAIGYNGTGSSILASSINIVPKTATGSLRRLKPLRVGNSLLHVSRQGDIVNELSYNYDSGIIQGRWISLFAKHLFDGHTIVDWCYRQSPDSTVWAVRDDGIILVLSYLPAYNVVAWSRIVTDGLFKSIIALPNGVSQDQIYVAVEREIDGSTVTYLEKIADDWSVDDGIEEARFLDSFKYYDNTGSATDTFSGLDHLEGEAVKVLGDGQVYGPYTVTSGSITIGKEVEIAIVGKLYEGIIAPLAFEGMMDGGSTLSMPKGYGFVSLGLLNSHGGAISADGESYTNIKYKQPLVGQPLEVVSGFTENISPHGAGTQRIKKSVWVKQDLPLPFHLLSIQAEVKT